MTDPLTRPLADNRLLRATGGPDVTVSLGKALGAVFDTPMMGGLAMDAIKRKRARADEFTEDQQRAFQEAEIARTDEVVELSNRIQELPFGDERTAAMDRLSALMDEGREQYDSMTRESVDAGRMQSQESLQEKYGELGLEFDRPMTKEEAELLADGKRAEIIRNALIDKAPGGIAPTAAKIGVGLLAMATDPLEVASTFIPIVGQAGKAAAIARFGRVGGRVVVGATEGLVGSALTEPIYAGLSRQAQLDYSMSEALLNVGLGGILGGGIGAGAGVLSRRAPSGSRVPEIEAPRLSIEHQREVADIALRQFVNGETINLGRLLDGTDLRGTTTLSRVDGIEFQVQQSFSLPAQVETRPSYLATDASGQVRTFDTLRKAEAYAEKVGGEALQGEGGFTVRQVAEGDFVRRPTGEPLTFRTERAAEKFIASARSLPEGAQVAPVTRNGKREFGVVKDMTPEEIAAIRANPERVTVPDGVNTREIAVLPDADARISQAVRGIVARTEVASDFARRSSDVVSDGVASVTASEEAARLTPETDFDAELADMEAMVAQVSDRLTAETRADLEAIVMMEERASTYAEVADAASYCLGRAA